MSKWISRVMGFSLGLSISTFAVGMYKFSPAHLSLAFIFLALAWVYREMYLGWDEDKKNWKFVSKQVHHD